MSFFDSEIVRAEISEIIMIQEDICKNIFKLSSMTIEEKKEHISLLEKLLNKQKILYARLSLSEDHDAIKWKNAIKHQSILMGMPENISINAIFNNMEMIIKEIKKKIE